MSEMTVYLSIVTFHRFPRAKKHYFELEFQQKMFLQKKFQLEQQRDGRPFIENYS